MFGHLANTLSNTLCKVFKRIAANIGRVVFGGSLYIIVIIIVIIIYY